MARTDNFWTQVGTYIKTIFPSGVDILINGTNKYLNFNTLSGISGYGFRDNGGVMEFKDSGGTWAPFGSGGGTTEVFEYANLAAFPATGVAATIYIAVDTRKIYHWNGSAYAELAPLSTEEVQDIIGASVIAGAGVSVTYDDPSGNTTVANTDRGSDAVTTHVAQPDPHPQYALDTDLAGKQTNIQFQDEGSNLGATGTVDTVDFVGSGVVATRTGNKVTVTIAGGGGGGLTLTEVEFDFGTARVPSKKFTVLDGAVSAGSKILIFPSPITATGRKGDDWEVDQPHFSAKAASGSFSLNVVSPYRMTGARRVYYAVV